MLATPQDFFAPALNSYCHVLCLPLATHISEFLSEPLDLTNLFRLSSKAISETSRQIVAWQWERVFREKWPVHYEVLGGGPSVPSIAPVGYLEERTHGRREEILEIFDREKKVGFCMSAMTAKVSWEQKTRCYVASYVSASHVVPERIPTSEVHRLRFCPPNVRDQLQPELAPPRVSEIYAFRVYAGLEGLQVGRGVELQWKMQVGSPFGWWHGVVEHVERKGATAAVTLTFGHFPQHSRWYRLRVVVGDGVMRRCGIGGYHGGIRSCTAAEEKHWMRFFPKDLRGSRKGHWAKGSVPFCLQGTLFLRSPCAKGHVAVSFGGSLSSPSGACNLLSGRKPRAMRGQIFQDPAQAANVPSPLQLAPLHCLPLPGCSFQVLSHLG
ncbi:unnamed protein product [Effrenium voratum]|nr:unnamed protein product [Effrenium voratum]